MNTDNNVVTNNVMTSYSFGAVLLDDIPTPTPTDTVVYWDETESDTTVSDSDYTASQVTIYNRTQQQSTHTRSHHTVQLNTAPRLAA